MRPRRGPPGAAGGPGAASSSPCDESTAGPGRLRPGRLRPGQLQSATTEPTGCSRTRPATSGYSRAGPATAGPERLQPGPSGYSRAGPTSAVYSRMSDWLQPGRTGYSRLQPDQTYFSRLQPEAGVATAGGHAARAATATDRVTRRKGPPHRTGPANRRCIGGRCAGRRRRRQGMRGGECGGLTARGRGRTAPRPTWRGRRRRRSSTG